MPNPGARGPSSYGRSGSNKMNDFMGKKPAARGRARDAGTADKPVRAVRPRIPSKGAELEY